MSKYDSFNSSSGNQNDELDLNVTPYTSFVGFLESIFPSYGGQFGQSIAVNMTGVEMIDGVLTQRRDNPTKFKVFSWDALGFTDDMDYDTTDAPKFHSQSFKQTYHFDTVAACIADDPTDPESVTSYAVMEDGELVAQDPAPHVLGDVVMWESGGGKPSATAKRLARVLTPLGDAAVVDQENIHGWLASSGIEIRPELKGQKVIYSIITRPGKEYDFNYPTLMTYPGGQFLGKLKTEEAGAQVVNTNGTPSASAAPSPQAVAVTNGEAESVPEFEPAEPIDDTTSEVTAAPAEGAGLPGPVESFVQAMVLFADSDDADILTELYATAESEENSLTSEMIDEVGEESILQAIRRAKSN